MANQLDEINGPVFEDGREINVINKQLPITVGVGSKIFEILLWILIIPGLIFQYRKVKARNYLAQLEQKIQAKASQVDNYLEQRVQVMKNLASLLSKAVDVDKDIMKSVAAYRSGIDLSKQSRTEVLQEVEHNIRGLQLQFENYPELQSHKSVREAMQQNIYLQKEITATRDIYNDSINQWNRAVNEWPAKQMVAAKLGYTTKIPFATTETSVQLTPW